MINLLSLLIISDVKKIIFIKYLYVKHSFLSRIHLNLRITNLLIFFIFFFQLLLANFSIFLFYFSNQSCQIFLKILTFHHLLFFPILIKNLNIINIIHYPMYY